MSDEKSLTKTELSFFHHREDGFTDAVVFDRGANGSIDISLNSGGGSGPDTYDREIDESGLDRDDVHALIAWLQAGIAPTCDECGVEIPDAVVIIKCGSCARVPVNKL